MRVRGLPLLRRVQMMKRHPVQLDHRIHRRQSLRRGSRCGLRGEAGRSCGEQPCRKKIELEAKALTVFVMPGCADTRSGGTPFSRPKADRRNSSLAIPWAFAELCRKTRQLEVLNPELERRVDERMEELAHAKEQLLRNVCSPLRTARNCNRNPRCFHISRGDSVHATLRKPALNFCSRCEALAVPKPPHSQKRPRSSPARAFCVSHYVWRTGHCPKQMNSGHPDRVAMQ